MLSKGWDDGAGEGHEFKGEAGGEFEVEEEFRAEEWGMENLRQIIN